MIFRYKINFISDIEQKITKLLVNIAVAPFVGVWIEIDEHDNGHRVTMSLPSWECGLKFKDKESPSRHRMSLPSWECGLKLVCYFHINEGICVAPFVRMQI